MNYAQERVDSIKAYRKMTLNDLRKNCDAAPWAWPTSMSFQKVYMNSPEGMRRSLEVRDGIYLCIYDNERYFFNVGKEEPNGV